VTRPTIEPADQFIRPAVRDLTPYEPGKPVEEIQRELGIERVVKLASNEGQFGPFPAALEAIQRCARELNRYPDGGAYRLRAALAERHGVAFEQIAPGSGADGVVDGLSQAMLDPGDEVVVGWPSFPSYVVDARKMGAEPRLVPLREHRYDPHALLEAVGPRTKIVFLCHPNNPTGTAIARRELDEFFARVPDHVLTVVDQAYFEYVDDPGYVDAVRST
jgi:histidinol-phosphate aminotransferase